MWKLAIEDDQGHKTVVNLVRDTYTVGRAQDNTVRLTERNISRRHAVIRRENEEWVLEDQASYNGCYVNGVRIAGPRPLEHGDLVQLGDYRLELISEESLAQLQANPHAVTSPQLPRSQTLTGQPDRLVMVVGPTPGVEYPLVGQNLVIGRGEECDISINHSSVSRIHAEIHTLTDGRYEIVDRGSANGVRVNGVELQRWVLDARDKVELGDIVLKFIPAGMIYRPGAEESQTITSNGSIAPLDAGASAGISSTTKLAAVAAALVVAALILGVVAFGSGQGQPQAGSSAVAAADTPDEMAAILAEARSALHRGDIEGAHTRITTGIPEGSNARESEAFREIESAWADSVLARAALATDVAAKRELLDRVARATTVDSERRKRAVDMIAQLDSGAIAVTELDKTPPATSAKPKLRKDDPSALAEVPASPKVIEEAMSGDRAKQQAAKDALKAKCANVCSDQERRTLRALCRSFGDVSCSTF
jgi:pSer/pThr/pTyr-binding forkhead associated (FHA) protein